MGTNYNELQITMTTMSTILYNEIDPITMNNIATTMTNDYNDNGLQ